MCHKYKKSKIKSVITFDYFVSFKNIRKTAQELSTLEQLYWDFYYSLDLFFRWYLDVQNQTMTVSLVITKL